MKQTLLKSLLIVFAIVMALPAFAQEFQYTYEGQTITYTVNSFSRRVTINSGQTVSPGALILPEHPKNGSVEYTLTAIGPEAFMNCSELTSISIPNTVTTIDENAFLYCDALTKAEFESIESLCRISFKNYGSNPLTFAHHLYINGNEVKDLVIPESITSIKTETFQDCSGLNSVTIGNSVTSIGDWAFSGCSGITSISLGNSLTTIGECAFQGCGFSSIYIPGSVTSIGTSAFNGCPLTKAEFESIESLCKISFGNAANPIGIAHNLYIDGKEIKDLVIPETVTSIGDWAFNGCTGLTSVTIGDSVTSIGIYAFALCEDLESVIIGNSVTSIADGTFCGCSSLTNLNIGNSVTSIGTDAFSNSGLVSLTIPDSVTTIDYAAFTWCNDLKSVIIGNSVTSIGQMAFYSCAQLESVSFGKSVKIIEYDAFCKLNKTQFLPPNLTKVEFASIESLCNLSIADEYANPLNGAKHLYIAGEEVTDLVIPNTVTTISDKFFQNCVCLNSVVVGNSVASIGKKAFSGCSNLTSVIIPGSVTSIGEEAFYQCRSLASVEIPNSVTSIENKTFYQCWSLTSASIANSVKSIGEQAFYGCTGLSTLSLGESVETIGKEAFKGCKSLISVTIPDSAISIGEYAFQDCSGMTSVVIGNSVSSIEACAFYGCNALASVTIPKSVTSIGNYAFGGRIVGDDESEVCVIFEEGIESINPKWFANVKSVIVPNSVTTIEGLENAMGGGWTKFLTLGTGIKNVGAFAFGGINTINISAVTPPALDKNVCNPTTPVSIMVVVPHDAAWAYKKDASWSKMTIMDPVAGSITVNLDGTESLTIAAYNQTGVMPVNIYKLKIVGPVADGDWKQFQDNMINCVELDLSEAESAVFPKIIPHRNLTIPYFPKDVKTLKAPTVPTVKEIPATVERIEDGIFNGVEFEAAVKTGPALTYIGSNAFAFSNLPAIDMSASTNLKEIGANAFANTMELTEVIMPSSLTKIGNYAFENSRVSKVNLPEVMEAIGDYAFSNCKVSQINLPEAMEVIGDYAFSYSGITEAVIPHAVAGADEIRLGKGAFKGCQLTRIILNNDVRQLPDECFRGTAITEIEFPESLEKIGNNCIRECNNLETLYLPQSLKSVGESCFSNNDNLREVTIPGSLKNLSYRSFAKCYKLSSVTIGDGVMTIGERAFSSARELRYVELPASITSIDNLAFESTQLSWISCLGKVPPEITGELKSDLNYQQSVLSMPSSAFFDYLQAPVWGRFGVLDGRVDIESDNGSMIQCGTEESTPTTPSAAPRQANGESFMVPVYNGQAVMVSDGSVLRFHISVIEGEELVSVTYNGKDVMNEIIDGYFTTPYISGRTMLKVETSYIALEVPEVLDATELTATAFTANWQPCEGAVDYLLSVESSADGNDYEPVQGWTDRNCGNILNVTFSDLIANNSYYRYAVKAVYANNKISGQSDWMNVKIDSSVVEIIQANPDGEIEIYTLQGVRMKESDNLAPGVYIKKAGGKSQKIIVR